MRFELLVSLVVSAPPMTSYTVMQIADSSYKFFASGLEHQNTHVNVVSPAAVGDPVLNQLYAHETVHAWNVKRLRPSDLWPYRYDRPQPTTWLWVSEGITDYYSDLVLVRSGVRPTSEFYDTQIDKMDRVASAPPVALDDASLSTWIHPVDGILAGLEVGDQLLTVRDVEITNQEFGPPFRARYAKAEGQTISIMVKRGGETKSLPAKIGFAVSKIEEDPTANAKAARIREGLLKGTVDK